MGFNTSPVNLFAIVIIFKILSVPIIIFFAKPLKATNVVTPKSTTPPTPGTSPRTDITKSTPVFANVLPEVSAISLNKINPRSVISIAAGSIASIKSFVSFSNDCPVS